jgi:hypothetical protein
VAGGLGIRGAGSISVLGVRNGENLLAISFVEIQI